MNIAQHTSGPGNIDMQAIIAILEVENKIQQQDAKFMALRTTTEQALIETQKNATIEAGKNERNETLASGIADIIGGSLGGAASCLSFVKSLPHFKSLNENTQLSADLEKMKGMLKEPESTSMNASTNGTQQGPNTQKLDDIIKEIQNGKITEFDDTRKTDLTNIAKDKQENEKLYNSITSAQKECETKIKAAESNIKHWEGVSQQATIFTQLSRSVGELVKQSFTLKKAIANASQGLSQSELQLNKELDSLDGDGRQKAVQNENQVIQLLQTLVSANTKA